MPSKPTAISNWTLGAAAEGQFFVLYQPTVRVATRAVIGVEALVRWRHPVRGMVGPDEFIPMLESTGLIKQVGNWVLDVARRQGALRASQGHLLTMAVNISSVQLDDDRVVESVHDALISSGLDPALLILELTETTLMHDVQSTAEKLKQLKSTGVRIAIDEFGTGYSSLAYLCQFPIDILKINQSFVMGLGRNCAHAGPVGQASGTHNGRRRNRDRRSVEETRGRRSRVRTRVPLFSPYCRRGGDPFTRMPPRPKQTVADRGVKSGVIPR
jgi:EAL domain-containing protein (putative c-di-GMP-specific phosphodiesterase class I)